MTPTPFAFCTDEDLATVAPSDFAALCPLDQAIARGSDGSILASDPWRLSSAAALGGVAAGQVLQVLGPRPPFRPPAECFGVASAGPGSVVLKRRGEDPGVGLPPATSADLSGVTFLVSTFGPQIRRASMDLERRFGVSDFIVGRRVSDLWDPTELRDAAVFSVLAAVYLDASRGTGQAGASDVWQAKSARYGEMLSDLLARVEVHWLLGSQNGLGPTAPSNRMTSTRLSR